MQVYYINASNKMFVNQLGKTIEKKNYAEYLPAKALFSQGITVVLGN